MAGLICPHQMKPHSDLSGVIYLQVKDTVTTDTVCNGHERKEDRQQQQMRWFDLLELKGQRSRKRGSA